MYMFRARCVNDIVTMNRQAKHTHWLKSSDSWRLCRKRKSWCAARPTFPLVSVWGRNDSPLSFSVYLIFILLLDNLVERLARHRMNLVRVGHPARILPTVLEHSLDIITRTCDSGQIVADVRKEMDETLAKISKCKNRTERRQLYQHLNDLRKDYRARERKVLDEVMTGAEVLISTLNGCVYTYITLINSY